jgi:uncharacterized phiE125 gp8 family phage protein
MALKVITPPATEPVTVAEVKAYSRILETNAEPAPGAPTVALAGAGAGNVENGAHRYRVTFVTADGETEGGTISAAVTVADKTTNGKVAISAIPTGGGAVTSRKLYRTEAGGTTYLLLATIADNTTTTYTDNVADATLGAGCPSTNTTADPLLNSFIKTARLAAENITRRALITQTLELVLDAFPPAGIFLPLPPLQSVTSVKYIDEDGVEQTLSTDLYDVDTDSEPGKVVLESGESWPTTYDQVNAVRVRYVAGYGAASAVPEDVKTWMKLRVGTMYENREAIITGTITSDVPRDFVDGLLDAVRIYE